MTFLTDCVACRYGQHEGHQEVIQAVPEGMMGGAVCPCTGDCAERNRKRPNGVTDADIARGIELAREHGWE